MKKKDFIKFRDNQRRMSEIADLIEKENREMTDAEKDEFESLRRENAVLQMRATIGNVPAAEGETLGHYVREAVRQNRSMKAILREGSAGKVADLDGTGLVPTIQGEPIAPLRKNIYEFVGLTVQHGLVGELRWPKYGKVTATWDDEIAAITPQPIAFSALHTKPSRLAVASVASRLELQQSNGVVENIINVELPEDVKDAIDAALMTTVGTTTVNDADVNKPVVGPFVAAKAAETYVQFAAAVPTRTELLTMKANVAKSGVAMANPCWVMTEDMKAKLEDEKVDNGSGRFVCENGMILGYPVYTTNHIEAGYVGFGDWSYQAAGFFGDESILVDPYSLADKNSVRFVMNTAFATATLRQEAFCLGGHS